MGKKQQALGKSFEIQLCWWLRKNGYYPEYHEKSVSGSQNGDITAIKDNIAYKIECKHLANKSGRFDLERIEANQSLAYKAYRECGNTNFIVAILWNNKIFFLDFSILQFYDKSVPLSKIQPSIENWSKIIDELDI